MVQPVLQSISGQSASETHADLRLGEIDGSEREFHDLPEPGMRPRQEHLADVALGIPCGVQLRAD